MNELSVWSERLRVGRLRMSGDGLTFAYDADWLADPGAFSLSTRLRRRADPYDGPDLSSWLLNLLPEGEAAATIGRATGTAVGDVLGLFSEIGRDTAGALRFAARRSSVTRARARQLTDREIEVLIEQLPQRPLGFGRKGVRLSLAGVQPKLGLAGRSHALELPIGDRPSTYILKPEVPRLWGLAHNEAFCLALARAAKIDAAQAEVRHFGKYAALLVTRYDRAQQGNDVRRIHQEDFCQALGLPPSRKYERNQAGLPGPSAVDALRLIGQVVNGRPPAAARIAFLEALVFNVMIQNTDAHAKNYSLLIHPGDKVDLAPLYDLVSAYPYTTLTRNLAMGIDGKNRGDHIAGRHWQRLARDAGMSPRGILELVRSALARVTAQVDVVLDRHMAAPSTTHPVLPQIARGIHERATRLVNRLVETE
jgi:serine/threonine-protein kinase HipA